MFRTCDHVKLWIVFIAFILCTLILTWIVYCIYRLEQLSHSIMIQKRHPNLLRIQAVFVVSLYLFGLPLMSLDWSHLLACAFSDSIQRIITCYNTAIFPFLTMGFEVSLTWRFWHIFYDLKYSGSHANSEWKYHLNPQLVEHDVWLKHKKTLGAPIYTRTPIAVLYCVLATSTVVTYHLTADSIYSTIAHVVALLCHMIPISILVILCWKLPQFCDDFFIRKELQLTAYTLVLSAVCSTIIILYGLLVSHDALMFYVSLNAICSVFIITITSFWYIPRTIRHAEMSMALIKRSNGKLLAPAPNTPANCYTLCEVLSNKKTFKMFMQHLSREVSTECLLCFVEIVQFELAMKQRFEVVSPEVVQGDAVLIADMFQRFDVVPQSSLVRDGFEQNMSKYNSDDALTSMVKEIKQIAYALFNKYIDIRSELVVNISSEDRGKLSELMCDEAEWMTRELAPIALYGLYDRVATVMFKLMRPAFMRFKRKPVYSQACFVLDQCCDHKTNSKDFAVTKSTE